MLKDQFKTFQKPKKPRKKTEAIVKRCGICGFRIRSKGHTNGAHHQSGKDGSATFTRRTW